MEVLMIRLDVFNETHEGLLNFWRDILLHFSDIVVPTFTSHFAGWEGRLQRWAPELYVLCDSHMHSTESLITLEEMQVHIAIPLGGEIIDTNGTSDIMVHRPLSKEEEKLKEEFYEINDSIRTINQEIEKIEYIILKELRKFWNHIDALIIDSYKELLYDVSGSYEFAEAFMNEMMRYPLVKEIGYGRRNHDYELLIQICYQLDKCIEDWIVDIEQLVGAPQ